MSDTLNKVITAFIGILIGLGGWTLGRTFELSTAQAIHQEKLAKLESNIEKVLAKDKEMQDQHTKLFEMLQEQTKSGKPHKMPSY